MNAAHSRRIAAAWRAAQAAVLALALGSLASAQQLTGNIYGYVADEQGGRLPGVSVRLTGIGAPKAQTTDERGEYRFLNLSPGTYTLTYALQGFTKVEKPDVQVSVGQNTNTSAQMKIGIEAVVIVPGEPALLDTRKVGTGAVIDQEQLKSIPTARDPWVIIQTVPGVQMDRVNVGGNESGQQSTYVGKGADTAQNVWNLDGVTITDLGALGSSPTYYDFDSFEEIQASTGGSDVTSATPGVQLNLVTKRGTNDVHGSARLFLADGKWQWDNLPQEAIDQGVRGGNRVNEVQDYGVEVGGPIWRDKVWAWGAYGRNQINLFNISGSPDNTTLKDVNAKINAQVTSGTSLTGTFSDGNKQKFGRNVSFFRPPPASWNQDGPTRIWKGEVSQVFSSSLFLTASYSSMSSGFSLTPQGGTDVNNVYINTSGQYQNSYFFYDTVRPQHQATANGSYFFSAGPTGNELKFGFNYRTASVSSITAWPGNGNVGDLANFQPFDAALLTRQKNIVSAMRYYSGYLSDTVTVGNLTVNAGVRYDFQRGRNLGSTSPGNPVAPDILPTVTTTDSPYRFDWSDAVPRVGATYALGQDKRTLLRASYARYADQLGSATVALDNAGALSGVYYEWHDLNGDHVITRDEINFNRRFSFYGFDPNNPGSTASPVAIDPNLKSGKTDEAIAGIEREVMPDFVVGVNYTYRKYSGAIFPKRAGLNPSDYHVAGFLDGTLADGTRFHQPYYALNAGIEPPAGIDVINRPDWNTQYNGVELNLQKRLTNRWMVRGSFTYNDWKQHGGPGACYEPTNDRGGINNLWPGTPIPIPTGGTCAGDDIAALPAGSASGAKNEVFLNSRWQFSVGGLYQLPLGFAVAGNVFGREGYPMVNFVRLNPGDGLGTRDNIIGKLGDRRYENVYELDLRLEKVIDVKPLQITLSADIFNVLNKGTVLQRNSNTPAIATTADGTVTVESPAYNQIIEIQSPRILRLGARVSF